MVKAVSMFPRGHPFTDAEIKKNVHRRSCFLNLSFVKFAPLATKWTQINTYNFGYTWWNRFEIPIKKKRNWNRVYR